MFVIEIPYFDIEKSLITQQHVRYKKLADGKFAIVDGSMVVKVIQNKQNFMLSCSEDEFYNHWYNFFDIQTPYDEIWWRLRKHGDDYMMTSATRAKGIRIFRQDLWQLIVSCVVGQGNAEWFRMQMVAKIAQEFGQKKTVGMRESGRFTYWEFPKWHEIYNRYYDKGGLDYLPTKTKENLLDLLDFTSTGDKRIPKYLRECGWCKQSTIDEIYLFGLGDTQRCPFSHEFAKEMKRVYREDSIPEAIENEFSDIADISGHLRQCILYNEYNPPRRYEAWE